MGKIAYVKIVWGNGNVWEYLADSLSRGKTDINYLKGCKEGISNSIVRVATTEQIKELISHHLLHPRIIKAKPIVNCKCCGKDIKLTKEFGAFCSWECVRAYNYQHRGV